MIDKIECPFKPGYRILDTYSNYFATVTEITEKGFKYKLDEPHSLGARFGAYQEGECYELGFPFWRLVDKES